MDRNLFNRTAYSLDARNTYSWRNIFLICIHVSSLYANRMKLMPETAGKTLEEIELFWTGQKCKS